MSKPYVIVSGWRGYYVIRRWLDGCERVDGPFWFRSEAKWFAENK